MNFAYFGPANTHEEALERFKQPHPYIAVDTETIGLKGNKEVLDGEEMVATDARTCIGVGIATGPNEAYYFPLGEGHAWANVPDVDLRPLMDKLQSPAIKVFFNCIFDLDRLRESLEIQVTPWADVSIACQVQGLPNSLDQVVGHFLMRDHKTIKDILPSGATMLDIGFNVTAEKCLWDCLSTFQMYEIMRMQEWSKPVEYNNHNKWFISNQSTVWKDRVGLTHDLSKEVQECYQVDLACTDLLRRMSMGGVKLREDRVEYWYEKLSREMVQFERYFDQIGFNPGSNVETGYILASRGNWLPTTKTGKQLKVGEDELEALQDPLAFSILAWRRRRTLRQSVIVAWRGQEYTGTTYRLDLATGRLASSERNMQNLPGGNYGGIRPFGAWNLRDCLEPENYVWHWMDYSQIEMRIIANQAQDPVMLDAYKNNKNLHEITEKNFWPDKTKADEDFYTKAKTGNFQLIFDASAETLSKKSGMPLAFCRKFIAEWFELYAGVKTYMESQKALTLPYVETDFGRRCRLPEGVRATPSHIDKCKINYPTQGTAADIIKRCMLILDAIRLYFPLQVHDEIVCDGLSDFPTEEISNIHPVIQTPVAYYLDTVWR